MSRKKEEKIKIGISIGDLNGVGPEVILKTIEDNRISDLCMPVLFASKKFCVDYAKQLQFNNLSLNYVKSATEIKGNKPNVVEIWKEEVQIDFGKESKEAAKYAHMSLEAGVNAIKAEEIDALVTAPINKNTIQSESFNFPGHTEYLQEMDEASDSLMLMLNPSIKIGVVTGHLPLKDVASTIDSDLILRKINILNKSLKEDFSIRKPKIALLGLNPHAGDNGLLGKEETEIILPAIQQAKSIGVMAIGPYPADGFFGSGNYRNFDAVLAMYHDQGLIPAKSFSFGEGVNFTAGLSFVRTSPDHGTAFEIAGKGTANESSFRNAIYTAIEVVKSRHLTKKLEEDVLPVNKSRN